MYCRFCGNLLKVNNKYCSKCGKEVLPKQLNLYNSPIKEENTEIINAKNNQLSLFIVVLTMSIAITLYILFSFLTKNII